MAKPRRPSEAELALWLRAMRDATPLEPEKPPKPRATAPEQADEPPLNGPTPTKRPTSAPPRKTANKPSAPSSPPRPDKKAIAERMAALRELDRMLRARGEGRLDPPAPFKAPPPKKRGAPKGGAVAGVDHNSWRRLQRGQNEIDARIDLHGLRQDEAKGRLFAFLTNCQRTGLRTVLVITGRGRDDRGALKTETPRWLDSAVGRTLVVAHSPAQPKDGGDGARYVRVRRLR